MFTVVRDILWISKLHYCNLTLTDPSFKFWFWKDTLYLFILTGIFLHVHCYLLVHNYYCNFKILRELGWGESDVNDSLI